MCRQCTHRAKLPLLVPLPIVVSQWDSVRLQANQLKKSQRSIRKHFFRCIGAAIETRLCNAWNARVQPVQRVSSSHSTGRFQMAVTGVAHGFLKRLISKQCSNLHPKLLFVRVGCGRLQRLASFPILLRPTWPSQARRHQHFLVRTTNGCKPRFHHGKTLRGCVSNGVVLLWSKA